ncbi:MAG: CBS domain-containing protein [Gammaproteobacteria bacterium]|jgi:CBS-domain-containing membrane protein
MKISEWIAQHQDAIVTVPPEASLREVMERLLQENCLRDVYVAGHDGRLLGHISRRRIVVHFLAEHRPAHTRRQLMERVAGGTAADFMNSIIASASPDEELEDVLHRQLEMEIEDMPVIDADGRALGAVNLTRVLQAYMQESVAPS